MSTATMQKKVKLKDPLLTFYEESPYENKKVKIEKMDSELAPLTFIRLKLPTLIPRDLIENVKGRTFTPEQFYEYQLKLVGNPYNHLYAMIDTAKKIKGYLWAESNLLDGSLFVNTFSISKDYWGKGKAVDMATEFLRELKFKTKSTRVFWATTNEKFFIKQGFKRSKIILMEYNEEK